MVFDRPFRAEVQLSVSGYIHNDVDFQPGSVMFGDVTQGTASQTDHRYILRSSNPWQLKMYGARMTTSKSNSVNR